MGAYCNTACGIDLIYKNAWHQFSRGFSYIPWITLSQLLGKITTKSFQNQKIL